MNISQPRRAIAKPAAESRGEIDVLCAALCHWMKAQPCQDMSNYQLKGRLHAKRFTTKPGNCRVCSSPLPTPRPTANMVCDACKNDPVRLESQRKRENKKERARYEAKRAAERKRVAVRKCQHRQEKDGEICGIEFEAEPRIGSDGANRGVHSWQNYCPDHRKPKAAARRRWLNRNVENYKRLQRNYRNRNLEKVRAKQRAAAKAKRTRVAAILAGDVTVLRPEVAKLIERGRKFHHGAGEIPRPKKAPEEKADFKISQQVDSLMLSARSFLGHKARLSKQIRNDGLLRTALIDAGFSERDIGVGLGPNARTFQSLARHWVADRTGKTMDYVSKAHKAHGRIAKTG
jgi:hypothetical protein